MLVLVLYTGSEAHHVLTYVAYFIVFQYFLVFLT